MGDTDYSGLQNPAPAYPGGVQAAPYSGAGGGTQAIVIPVKAVVGEKISLGSLVQPPYTVKSVVWNIPAGAIRKYHNTIELGLVVQLQPADYTKTDLSFYWTEGGAKSVTGTFACSFAGYDVTLIYRLDFDIEAPVYGHLTGKTTKVTVRETKRLWFLEFKDKEKPGIIWDWEVTMPKSSAGFLKDLQTIKPGGRVKEQLLEPGSRKTKKEVRVSTKGKNDIVDDDPVQGKAKRETTYDLGMFSEPAKIPAGQSSLNAGISDSPGTQLAPLDIKVSIDEHFKYFVLFKPDKPDAIWVPVAKLEWFWQAEAEKTNKRWKLKSSKVSPSKKGEATKEFPIYDGNALHRAWQ